MVKILCIGDPHFKKNNTKSTDKMHRQIIYYLKKNKVDFVVVLGDTLNDFESIDMVVLNRAVKFLRDIKNITKLFLIIGNHDRINNEEAFTDLHPFYALKEWSNTTVVDDEIITYEYKNKNYLFSPYLPNKMLIRNLPEEKVNDIDIVFAHQEIFGCKMGAFNSEDGDKWPIDYPLFISGHIHQYQIVQNNVFYPGTGLQHGYVDTLDKSISLITDEKLNKIEFDNEFENKDNIWYHKRIYIEQDKKKVIKLMIGEIDNYKLQKNVEYKIKIMGTQGELKDIMKNKKIIKWQKLGHIVVKDIFNNDIKLNQSNLLKETISYKDELYNNVKNDEDLLLCYNEIFT